MMNRIREVEIYNLWGRYNYKWALNPDVNILAGLNGSGKTTLINIIDAVLCADTKRLKGYGVDGTISGEGFSFSFNKERAIEGWTKISFANISTFDNPLYDRKLYKKGESQLDIELDSLIYQRHPGTFSFTDYRLKATSSPEKAAEINNRIQLFFDILNRLFVGTGKLVSISTKTNKLMFDSDSDLIELNRLSSGEKQLLIILFKVFLMEEIPSILLMDEPENSLHIDWQQQLIDVIRKLNPNCQIILSTHSPSIFGEGWGDKLFFLEDLQQG
jgi:predicted ATP-dependent endonuclease of OLD family